MRGNAHPMKSICSILILMIVVHSQCGVQCLSADLSSSHKFASPVEQPTCHQHGQDPPTVPSGQDPSRHEHEKDNSCGQAQTVEFKIAPISKCVLQLTVMESIVAISAPQVMISKASLIPGDAPSPPPSTLSRLPILRI